LSLFKRDAVYCRTETVYLGKRCCNVNFGTSLFYNTQHLFSTMTPHLCALPNTTTPQQHHISLHCLFTASSLPNQPLFSTTSLLTYKYPLPNKTIQRQPIISFHRQINMTFLQHPFPLPDSTIKHLQ